MSKPSIICGIANIVTILIACFLFLHYIFHESGGSEAKEVNSDETEHRLEHQLFPAPVTADICHGWSLDGPGCSLKALSSCGNSSRTISFTFDDDGVATKEIIDALIEELRGARVKATFFMSPHTSVSQDEKCEMVQAMSQGGQEVQLLGWDGKMINASTSVKSLQLNRARAFIRKCSDTNPSQFRPPNGVLNKNQAIEISQKHGLVIDMWSFSSERAEHLMELSATAVDRGESMVARLTDLKYWGTSGPLAKVIAYFRENGYQFPTTAECYGLCARSVCVGPWLAKHPMDGFLYL